MEQRKPFLRRAAALDGVTLSELKSPTRALDLYPEACPQALDLRGHRDVVIAMRDTPSNDGEKLLLEGHVVEPAGGLALQEPAIEARPDLVQTVASDDLSSFGLQQFDLAMDRLADRGAVVDRPRRARDRRCPEST